MKYDEIDYLLNDISIVKTCLPEGSLPELRIVIAAHVFGQSSSFECPNRVVVLSFDKDGNRYIRLDSSGEHKRLLAEALVGYNLAKEKRKVVSELNNMFDGNRINHDKIAIDFLKGIPDCMKNKKIILVWGMLRDYY